MTICFTKVNGINTCVDKWKFMEGTIICVIFPKAYIVTGLKSLRWEVSKTIAVHLHLIWIRTRNDFKTFFYLNKRVIFCLFQSPFIWLKSPDFLAVFMSFAAFDTFRILKLLTTFYINVETRLFWINDIYYIHISNKVKKKPKAWIQF